MCCYQGERVEEEEVVTFQNLEHSQYPIRDADVPSPEALPP